MKTKENKLADGETQVKDKPSRIVFKYSVLALLLILLVISYIFSFSLSLYPNFFKYKLDGIFSSKQYFGAQTLDLIVIEPYSKIGDAQKGDIVCYYTNSYHGSGRLSMVDGNMMVVELRDGSFTRISTRFVVGKQVKKIGVLGLFVKLYFSYYGAAILTLLTICYCVYLTMSRINYENTQHGKELLQRFRKEQKEIRSRKQMLSTLEKNGGVDFQALTMLEGDFYDNLAKLKSFDLFVNATAKDKYKFILKKVYDAYIYQPLNKKEMCNVGNVIELMCEAGAFDLDMQYMLSDLILKTKIVDFDFEAFRDSAFNFMKLKLDESDFLNFISVLFLLLKQNPKLRNDDMGIIADEFIKLSINFSQSVQKNAVDYAQSILNLINS